MFSKRKPETRKGGKKRELTVEKVRKGKADLLGELEVSGMLC